MTWDKDTDGRVAPFWTVSASASIVRHEFYQVLRRKGLRAKVFLDIISLRRPAKPLYLFLSAPW